MLVRAQALSPGSAWQLQNAVQVNARLGRFGEAGRLLKRAEQLTGLPYSPAHIDLSIKVGRLQIALDLSQRAIRRDPLDPDLLAFRAQSLASLGRTGEALTEWERLVGEEWNRNGASLQGLSTALSHGDPETIRVWLERCIDYAESWEILKELRNFADDQQAVRQWLRAAYDGDYPDIGTQHHWIISNFAAYLGDVDLALDILEQDADSWSVWMPHYAGMRATPRFAQWVTDRGLTDFWRESGWGEYCQPAGDQAVACH